MQDENIQILRILVTHCRYSAAYKCPPAPIPGTEALSFQDLKRGLPTLLSRHHKVGGPYRYLIG